MARHEHASRRQAMVEAVWHKHGAFVHQQIIWVKDRPVLTHSWYSWQHEPCFFGWVRPHQPDRVARDYMSTTWQIPTVAPGRRTDHPTSKPVEVFAIPIRQHTRPADVHVGACSRTPVQGDHMNASNPTCTSFRKAAREITDAIRG